MNYRLIREKYNLSRDEMAQLLGLTLRTIGSYETGKIEPPVVTRNIYMIMDDSSRAHAATLGINTYLKRHGAFFTFKIVLRAALL